MTHKQSPSRSIRVFVVDDHPMIRTSLRDLFASRAEFRCCGEAGSCEEALRLMPDAAPDVVVVDLGMPGDNGFELLRKLKISQPRVHALVFSMHEEAKYALRAIKDGAQGYVMKTSSPDAVLDAVIKVSEGKRVVSDEIQQQLLLEASVGDPAETRPDRALSSREWQVFEGLGHGLTMKEIAERLQISEKTVGSFCNRIKTKLDKTRLRDVAQMAHEWFRQEML